MFYIFCNNFVWWFLAKSFWWIFKLAFTSFIYSGNTDDREKLTVPYAVDYWINGGFPAHKIALGMGTYGRAFNLQSPAQHGLAAPTPQWSSSAPRGQYTKEGKFMYIHSWHLLLISLYIYTGFDQSWLSFV